MTISVVIPAYNAERFLRRTLESVFAQTLLPDEILICDDGSVDGTAELAESFGPPVRVLRLSNEGASSARNFGAAQATGEWIAFLDADDLWEPGKLERQMAELARNPDADLCYTSVMKLEQHGDEMRLCGIIPVPTADLIERAVFERTTFIPSSVVIRRSVFLASGGFDATRRYAEDWELWLRLLRRGVKFAGLTEPLTLYRIHGAGVSSKVIEAQDAIADLYRREIYPQLNPLTRWYRYRRFLAEHESGVALVLREQGDPRHLSMMVRSLLRDPFYKPFRYKALAHMIYTRLRGR